MSRLGRLGGAEIVDIDNSILQRTGRSVRNRGKVRDSKMEELEGKAIESASDVEDLFDFYKVDDLNDAIALQDYLTKAEEVKRDFRRIHARLKSNAGTEQFLARYPYYEQFIANLNTSLKDANKKLMELLKAHQEPLEIPQVDIRYERDRAKLKSDRRFFFQQTEWELKEYEWDDLDDVADIKSAIKKFEIRLDSLFKMCSDLGFNFSEEEIDDLGFKVQDDELMESFKGKIRAGKERLITLKNEKEKYDMNKMVEDERLRNLAEEDRAKKEKESEDKIVNDLMECAKNLHFEIKSRYTTFSGKCKIDISELNDFEILNLKKHEEDRHVELRELIDKVSGFEKFVLPCGDKAKDFRIEVIKWRDEGTACLTKHLSEVNSRMDERDISEKKLKNSAALEIKIPKFEGYASEMDVYTLKSEFKKLVEPFIQKSLWADHLKKNLLGGSALTLVLKVEEIDKIWEKLFEVYGNTHLMLQNKLGALDKFTNLDKVKDDEKIAVQISTLLNLITDLCKLAETYSMENDLYYGVGIHKILDLMGKYRERKFVESIALKDSAGKEKWLKLIEFLQTELKKREALVLHQRVRKSTGLDKDIGHLKTDSEKKKQQSGGDGVHLGVPTDQTQCPCSICGKSTDHILSHDGSGKPYVEYIACKCFVEKSCRDRSKLLFKKRLCNKCLKPGVKFNADHVCNKDYICGKTFVKDGVEKICQRHVLICEFHYQEADNLELLERYKQNVIRPNNKFKDFTKNILISCFSESYLGKKVTEKEEASIFAFQTIEVAPGVKLNFFYDNGCGDAIFSKDACDMLKELGRAKIDLPGPLLLKGVNDQESSCPHGAWSVSLPLKDGGNADLSGLCLDVITTPFPKYPLEQVEKDIRSAVERNDKKLLAKLPKLSKEAGGTIHVMLGKHYLKYFPREVFRMASGLTLYESMFRSDDGTTGVVSGPHAEFTKMNRTAHFALGKKCYLSQAARSYIDFLSKSDDVPLLGNKEEFGDPDLVRLFTGHSCTREGMASTNFHSNPASLRDDEFECLFGDTSFGGKGVFVTRNGKNAQRGPKCLKNFEDVEKSGTEISYRCMDCRNCKECLKGGLIEEISIQEEAQQDLINKGVVVDVSKRRSSTNMPFIADPNTRLITNDSSARKVYDSQIRKLNKSEKDRNDIIESESKLQDLGYVEWLENLDEEDQKMILEAPVKYFIPWRVVWSKSISTPVRLVYDASSKTSTGYSLNCILPKGSNNMNNLIQILLRWSIKKFGYHTDVRKMYNSVEMEKDFWKYQLYWWSNTLRPEDPPKIKAIKTCIYGVKCSGNQAERALRLIAELMKDEYPMAYDIIMNDVYVDDCISGEDTLEARNVSTDQVKLSLEKGGFTLKGFTFSGEDPDDHLSADGKMIMTGGLRYFPKGDFLMLNIGKINFSRKVRGRKLTEENDVPLELTLRVCVSVLGEVFDPLGRVAPIIGAMKLDVSDLHRLGLGWDDKIPENLREVWNNNFEMIEELGSLKYNRVIVPPNAKNLDIFTLDTADASSRLICVAIYARFELMNGSHSCQLVFSRTKVVPEGTTTPRAELMASSMNASTGFTVQKAFGKYHKRHLKLTDSMVAFYWINSTKSALKTFVRGLVIEINRLTDSEDWRHVEGCNMPADLGTRKGVKISDIAADSDWCNGLPWMCLPEDEFPIKTIDQVKLDQQQIAEANKEKIEIKSYPSHYCATLDFGSRKFTKMRYKFSKYLLDPNKYRFRKILRIMALVLTFVRKISKNVPKVLENKNFKHRSPFDLQNVFKDENDKFLVISRTGSSPSAQSPVKIFEFSEQMLKSAFNYFAIKASAEVKQFVDKKKYVNISKEIDGVLYYSGRILPDQKFLGYPELCEAALDLCQTTFCVPVMDQYSPVAISIALEIHWFHPDVCHRGIESLCRQVERVAHIIGGQNLMIFLKNGCKKCRILNKELMEVVMGPIQDVNFCIAPAFYASQIDIFGPFKCYSPANKRAVLKCWFLIFCCCTTSATSIHVMEDYSTDAFLMGFIRFSCRVGYPKYLLPDAGSQLMKGCKDMTYSYVDSKQILFKVAGVDYKPCPVGAHYVHGRVERKIKEIKKSVQISVGNERLSIVQWETLMAQIANSANNMPIGTQHSSDPEYLDLITPNRLILGRNNDRCPNKPLSICPDHKRMIESNANIFRAWFTAWLVSYVPSLVERPKWHTDKGKIHVGDVVLFLKSDKEFDLQYQYGRVSKVYEGKDGRVRRADVEYQNHNEEVKRSTERGVRELVVVHPIDELDIYTQLHELHD